MFLFGLGFFSTALETVELGFQLEENNFVALREFSFSFGVLACTIKIV